MTLSLPQITAQLDAVLAREPAALAIAIRSAGRQDWPAAAIQRGRRFSLRWCDSMLAMREALCDVEQAEKSNSDDAGLVLMTPLGSHEIAEDIAARLARGRIFQPEGWEIVRQLFGAKEVDARLGRFSWMPQVLVDGAAQGAYAPVANGFLDLETAWRELLQRFLQLDVARPDAGTLLRWTMPVSYTHLDVYKRQALRMSCHIRYAEPRQGQAQSGGQLARECLDLNRELWGEKPEGVPGAFSPQGPPFVP